MRNNDREGKVSGRKLVAPLGDDNRNGALTLPSLQRQIDSPLPRKRSRNRRNECHHPPPCRAGAEGEAEMTDGDPNEAHEVVPFDRTKLRLERLRLAGTPDSQTLGGPTNA
jgi:hypothetical protein